MISRRSLFFLIPLILRMISLFARPTLWESAGSLFFSKDGRKVELQEVIDWQHDYDHIDANISLHLHSSAGLIGLLPIADNSSNFKLGSAVKYLFEFHYMLCNPHAHLSIGVFDWWICLLLVNRISLFCRPIQYFYRIYLLGRRSACNIFIIIFFASVYYLYSSKQTSLASPLSIQ